MKMLDRRVMDGGFGEDWWGKFDGELLDCLRAGPMSAAELGRRLGVSERSVVSLLALLPDSDTVRITRIELGTR